MCGEKPKPPKPTKAQKQAEADAAAQRKLALEEQRAIRAENKEQRKQMRLGMLGMRLGRQSLLTGGRGGAGYAAPMARSLLTVGG
jgi:hypothetical protein